MIIQALYDYYQLLLADPESGVSPPGYCKAKVSHALVLNDQGLLIQIIDLRKAEGKKLLTRLMDVPEHNTRSGSGIHPFFLCDNSGYVLGIDAKGKPERALQQFDAFRNYHHELLDGIDEQGATALLRFLDGWDPERALDNEQVKQHYDGIVEGGNLVFRLLDDPTYLQDQVALRSAWEKGQGDSETGVWGQCLITGQEARLARLHPFIKGVTGAQSSGASLVSFNLNAFTSYGKEQSFNAPVSQEAAFAYTTALNYLLADERHRIRIGDATTVFWAARSGQAKEETLFAAIFDPEWQEQEEQANSKPRRDPKMVKLARGILERIRNQQPINEDLTEVDPDVRFYILGLSPNASRLSVRFWYENTFGAVIQKIGAHYRDMAIEKTWDNDPDFIPPWRLLKETAVLGDSKNVSPLLAGALSRSILMGQPYPQRLFTDMLSRIRADQQINYVRAAMIKACLVRNYNWDEDKMKEVNSMLQDERNNITAERLGRLFALLEKAQQDANPGINATIRDRYFGAASATPGVVFPQLFRLAQHHMAKSEFGFAIDKKIEEVLKDISSFPSHLDLENQGLFILGYYHQRNALYRKSEKKEG